MLATLVSHIPADSFACEVKWDGVRAIAYIEAGRLRLLSRNNLDITSAYPELGSLPRHIKARNAILDGEIVALNEQGLPDFERLQRRMHVRDNAAIQVLSRRYPVIYMIFDILYLNDTSALDDPYLIRRDKLSALKLNEAHWQTPEYYLGDPAPFLEATRHLGVEGVIAKQTNSPYVPGKRTGAWLKIKHVRKQEFVIGGWHEGEGARSGVAGALLLGYYDTDPETARHRKQPQKLVYAGKVGTGFSMRMLEEIQASLRKLEIDTNPFEVDPPREREIHFVRPELVAEVRFGSWTSTHMLRHPSFEGLRDDKPACEIIREDDVRKE